MSINNIANTVFPNTLSGLESLNVTNITINGFDVTTLFVPYTGANTNVDLNNKNLSSVNNVGTTTLTATGLVQGGNLTTTGNVTASGLIQGGNITTTGRTTTDTLTINTLTVGGAGLKTLAANAVGDVVEQNLSLTYVPYSGATSAVNLSSQNLTSVNNLSANAITSSGLTSTQNLRVSNVPAGTPVYNLAVNAGGDVIQGPSTTTTVTTFSGGSTGLTPSVPTSGVVALGGVLNVASGGTGVSNSTGNGFVVLNNTPSLNGVTLTGNVTYTSVYANTPAFALGIDSSNIICRFPPTNQIALTAVSANNNYNLVFTNSTGATSNATLSIDDANNIQYNPSTDTLIVPNLTVSSSASIIGYAPLASPALTGVPTAPTASNGTNTTQIATCAFVLANAGSGFLPLTGGTMTGSITFANTNTVPITLTGASVTAYTYTIRDSFFTVPMLEFTTRTNVTVGSIGIGVPIRITNTNSTALITLPYDATTQYSKSIANSGGDNFISFNSSTVTPANPAGVVLSTQVSINNTLGVASTVGLYGVNATSNDGVAMWLTSGGTQCGSLVLSDTYGTTVQTSTPTTSWGRYFAVGGQVFQDFYGAFEWRGTNTLGSTTWSTVASVAKMSTAQMGFALGSMFDFSSAGTWDNNNSLFVTTGGLGGTNTGVGIGYNTASDIGLLVCIAPNVAWKGMRYKAANHQFFVDGNTLQAGVNSVGLYADNAGFFTNYAGAVAGGLGGVGSGDLVYYANSSGVHRFFSGVTQAIVIAPASGTGLAFGTSGIGLTTVAGASYGNVSTYGAGLNGWSGYDLRKRWTLMSNDAGGNISGYHDNINSWVWTAEGTAFWLRQPNNYFSQLPQQSYVSNQVLIGSNNNRLEWGVLYSTYYYAPSANWRGGTLIAAFYKASATSLLRFSGCASYFVPSGGMYQTQILIYNLSTGTITNIYLNQFTNVASNHVSYPIMGQTGSGLAVGSYDVYMYTSGLTDANDHLYMLSEIVPS